MTSVNHPKTRSQKAAERLLPKAQRRRHVIEMVEVDDPYFMPSHSESRTNTRTPVIGEKTKTTDDGVEVTTGDMIEHRKLQVDARKWMASKPRFVRGTSRR